MLRINSDVQMMPCEVRGVCDRIRGHDANLASQLRRSAQSVALNLAEGMAASGGVRRNAYAVAAREAKECVAAIDVAERWGYTSCDPAMLDRCRTLMESMRGRIDDLIDLQVHVNTLPGPHSCDLSLTTIFPDPDAYHRYTEDPVHLEVRAQVLEMMAEAMTLDYEKSP